jgi:hypothetical protein
MGTKPKAPDELARPRRRFGDVIRAVVGCPVCRMSPDGRPGWTLRVVAYRQRTIRLECPVCGLRFSIDVENFSDVIGRSSGLSVYADVIYNRREQDKQG